MHRYNVVSRTLLILTVITFALAAPLLVQEKRQACVDVMQVPEDMITMLEKRARDEDLEWLWNEFGLRYHENEGNLDQAVHPELAPPPNAPPPNPADVQEPEIHAPPPNPAEAQVPEGYEPPPNPVDVQEPEIHAPPLNPAEAQMPEGYEPPQNPVEVQVPEVHAQPPNPAEAQVPEEHEPPQYAADSDHESMDLDDDAPPASPGWSSESEDFHMAPY